MIKDLPTFKATGLIEVYQEAYRLNSLTFEEILKVQKLKLRRKVYNLSHLPETSEDEILFIYDKLNSFVGSDYIMSNGNFKAFLNFNQCLQLLIRYNGVFNRSTNFCDLTNFKLGAHVFTIFVK